MFAPRVAKPQTKAAASANRSLEPQRAKPGGDHERKVGPESPTARAAPRGVSWDFSKIAIFPPDRAAQSQSSYAPRATPLTTAIQAKLVGGSVDDPLEHEADRVADHVMRMPDSDLSAGASPPQMSRKCAACVEEEDKAKRLQMKPALAGEVPAAVHEALRSAGQPLDSATRAYFEPRYGRSFADVRIHNDSLASRSAEALGARAYAVGQDIVFGAAEYQPGNKGGDRLLAHELAHVVQQSKRTIVANVVQRQADAGDKDRTDAATGAATGVTFAHSFNTPDSLGPIILSKSSKPQVKLHVEYLPQEVALEIYLSLEKGGEPNSDTHWISTQRGGGLDDTFTFMQAVPPGTYFLRFEGRSEHAKIPGIKGSFTLSA